MASSSLEAQASSSSSQYRSPSSNGPPKQIVVLDRRASPISPVSVVTETASPSDRLLRKRQALQEQRVRLERRLFEVSRDVKVSNNDIATPRTYKDPVSGTECTWEGAWDECHLPTGAGRLVLPDQVYTGSMVAGRREGVGTCRWHNGQVYTGQWLGHSRSGRGTHTWPDGRRVTGHWKEGHLHGPIYMVWPDGSTYDGTAALGKKQGRGQHTYASGKVYAGQYQDGREQGFGRLTEADGQSRYRGTFHQGQRHGYGVQLWKDKTYDGEWKSNRLHGQGKLVWQETGASYQGEFINGQYHGHGTWIDERVGRTYVGQWELGAKHGQGRDLWIDGKSYRGGFVRGRRHGYGRLTMADGGMYTGGWQKGKRWGRGIQLAADGSVVHCGLWEEDRPVEKKEGSAMLVTRDDLHLTAETAAMSEGSNSSPERSLDDSALDRSGSVDPISVFRDVKPNL